MFQLERDNRSIFKIIGGIRSASYGGPLFLLLDIRCRRHQPGSLKLKASLYIAEKLALHQFRGAFHGSVASRLPTKYCGVVVTQCAGIAALTNHGSSSLLVAGL